MAKAKNARQIIILESTAGTGYRYTTKKNKRNHKVESPSNRISLWPVKLKKKDEFKRLMTEAIESDPNNPSLIRIQSLINVFITI